MEGAAILLFFLLFVYREHPLPGASPLVLKIADQGILGLYNHSSMIWSSNKTTSANATAKLLDTGNLVVIGQDRIIWQSFDHPTDTLLPGMKVGRDYLRSKEWHLSSWKSSLDPAPGEFTWGADPFGYPESKLKQGGVVKFRSRPWRNQSLSVSSGLGVLAFTYDVIIDEDEMSFAYYLKNSINFLQRSTLNSSGHLESWLWLGDGRGWHNLVSIPRGACDTYNIFNAYGTCNVSMIQQSCTCLDEKRFAPKNQMGWDTADWSGGCIRRTPLRCENRLEGFIKYSNVKLPDTKNTWFNMSMTLEECGIKCLQNCTPEMVNHGGLNNNIVLELSLSSSMVEHNTTKKPCSSLNFDPSLSLAVSGDHDSDRGGQDSASGPGGGSSLASVCVKRDREVKSEVISTPSSEVEEEDDDDNSVNGRKKLRLTKAQSALLEEAFKQHSSLNPKHKQELARELKLRPRQVEVWFQNRRARTKLKQTEVECEYMKKCCETLKEENTRLHKELQELKALKQSTQASFMQLPVATLTMCPSCKRVGDTTSSANTRPFTMAPKPPILNQFANSSAAC